MDDEQNDLPSARGKVVLLLVVWLGTLTAVLLIIYALVTPDGAWAFWGGLAALAVVGLTTTISRAARLSRRR